MSVLPIYTYGSPVLRKKARAVSTASDDILRLVLDMFETMHKAQGIGLAATQVGSLERVLVVDLSEMEGFEDFKPMTVINPEILGREDGWTMEEGCLSVPDVRGDVERAGSVRLKYRDANFHEQEVEASGLLGRVLLHEIDHLDGVLFLDHMTPDLRSIHEEKLKKIEKGEIEVGYPIVTAQNQMV